MGTLPLAGVDVPRVGLGTNRLRHTPEHVAFVREAVEAGVRHIDTAHLYTDGDSERAIGEALGGVPDGMVVATKGGYGGAGQGRREVLRAQIEQSLQSLRTERIPLYYLHRIDPETPLETSLGTIAEAVERGEIGAVGLSDVGIEEIERARQLVPIAAVQNGYDVDHRRHDDVVGFCEAEGIAFVAFYPLRGGGSRSNREKLAWLLGRSPVVAPIPGTLSLEHLRENLAALSDVA